MVQSIRMLHYASDAGAESQTLQFRSDESVFKLLKQIESDLDTRLGQQTLSDFIKSN